MSSLNAWYSNRLDHRAGQILEFLRRRSRLQLLLFVGPAVLLVLGALILPLLYMVYISFLNGTPPSEFTLQNYERLASTDTYVNIILDTVVLTVQTSLLVVVLGYTLAYGIAMYARRRKLLLLMVILPFWTNYLVRNFSLISIFQNQGPFEQIVNGLLFFLEPISIDILYTRPAVLMGLLYSYLPVAVLPIYASIARMDKSLISASKDLGAGPVKTFLYITLPRTKEGIFVGTLLVAIPTFGAFVTPAMLGGPTDNMIGSLIELQYMQVYDVPFGSAVGTATSLFVVVVLGVVFAVNGVPMIDND
ncbi:ABC transporter permease [Halococcus sp. IIIV-5B]|uniref:ABC transporter permease n=1 Tax=Halococcus sp. IIIV-5B TaxID=2321230 RepID=UPI000E74C549|nr:ABC transporter permease [Halococcus sp. IIIV-5B]RJT07472.1 ABC transporter permease [Halococcus sp. IIIV-5B]